jgi:hypothetical protein
MAEVKVVVAELAGADIGGIRARRADGPEGVDPDPLVGLPPQALRMAQVIPARLGPDATVAAPISVAFVPERPIADR